jgi:flagellar biosynthetic protein FlhB
MSGSADDRTEAATPRRLERAREQGQVALSQEAAPLAVLAAGALLIGALAPATAHAVAGRLALLLARSHDLTLAVALRQAGAAVLIGAGPFLLVAAFAAAAAVLAQTGGAVTLTRLRPDFSRLDPRRGLARVLTPAAFLEAGKALLKLVAAGAACWMVLSGALPELPASLAWEPAILLARTLREVLRVLLVLLGAQTALAGFDILRARFRHARDLRMTRQELRDEFKDAEGDPHVKARLRRIRQQRARRRMLQAVPKATVVVTNPTHYAVALAYQRGATAAPRVVAKGADEVAARIRETAMAHRVPLVANPPLARALYAAELDAEIPRELYQAVAELIAYVWRLRSQAL